MFLTVLPQNTLVPSQQGFFSAGEPASVFKDMQVLWQGIGSLSMRRWNGRGGGGRRGGPGVWCPFFSGAVSFGQVAGPVAGGAAQMLSESATD